MTTWITYTWRRTIYVVYSSWLIVSAGACASDSAHTERDSSADVNETEQAGAADIQGPMIITPEAGFAADTSSGMLLSIHDLVWWADSVAEVSIQRIEPAVVGLDGGLTLAQASIDPRLTSSSNADAASVWRPVILEPVENLRVKQSTFDVYIVPEYAGSVARAAFSFYRPVIDLSRSQERSRGIVFLSL